MSLIRFVARSLFASAFVADGIGKLTKPSEVAADAEQFTQRVAPLVQREICYRLLMGEQGSRLRQIAAVGSQGHQIARAIDRLKTDAPFWKREETAAGARWVEARATDDDAARRWS